MRKSLQSLSGRVEAVYNVDSMTDSDFIQYNYAELNKVAVGKNNDHVRWLNDYLKTCPNTAERQNLLKLLALAEGGKLVNLNC